MGRRSLLLWTLPVTVIIYIHVIYIVYYIHGFTQISSEACRLRLNINYWLIKNNIRITPSNLRENERGRWRDIKWLNQRGWARNPVKPKIAVQAGVYKFLLPFIFFSYGVYLIKRLSPEGVLRISSDRNDEMGAKIKIQNNPLGFKQNPTNRWTKIYPLKNPMPNFRAIIKISRKHKMT